MVREISSSLYSWSQTLLYPIQWVGTQVEEFGAPLKSPWPSSAGCLEIAYRIRYIAPLLLAAGIASWIAYRWNSSEQKKPSPGEGSSLPREQAPSPTLAASQPKPSLKADQTSVSSTQEPSPSQLSETEMQMKLEAKAIVKKVNRLPTWSLSNNIDELMTQISRFRGRYSEHGKNDAFQWIEKCSQALELLKTKLLEPDRDTFFCYQLQAALKAICERTSDPLACPIRRGFAYSMADKMEAKGIERDTILRGYIEEVLKARRAFYQELIDLEKQCLQKTPPDSGANADLAAVERRLHEFSFIEYLQELKAGVIFGSIDLVYMLSVAWKDVKVTLKVTKCEKVNGVLKKDQLNDIVFNPEGKDFITVFLTSDDKGISTSVELNGKPLSTPPQLSPAKSNQETSWRIQLPTWMKWS